VKAEPKHKFSIHAKSLPHSEQRYETVGDWWEKRPNANWHVRVSEMSDWRYMLLVIMHELIEMSLCVQRGIPEERITAYDVAFEANRLPGNVEEPGEQPDAPYRREHLFAEQLEHMLADELGVDWKDYEAEVMCL